MRRPALVLIGLGLASPSALAQAAPAAAQAKKVSGASAFLPGANSKEPVSIDAGKLDYFDKEQKLVYTGDVVAKQGESTLKATVLIIFLSKDTKKDDAKADGAAAGPASPASGSSIRHMDAKGPVTIVSKDEVGTGDNGSYDKAENKIVLVGNVTLTQATNVVKGDKLVYDMTSGQAQVTSGQTLGRVKSVFTPGSGTPGGGGSAKKPKPGAKPDTAPEAR